MLSRRIFLASGSAAGVGLVLGISGCAREAVRLPDSLNMWLAIAPDGMTTIRVNATDIGQGSQTGLAQIVADELDADWKAIRVEMAPVTDAYMVKSNDYFTGGSSSIREQYLLFAQAGATAREMLLAAAARRWNIAQDACTARDGFVHHSDGKRKLAYGILVAVAAKMAVPRTVSLKPASQRRYIGKPLARLDIPQKVNGRAIYGIDVKVAGMHIATLAQCPFFGGKLESVDEGPAHAVKGVEHVVKLSNAIVVIARNFHAAKKGLEALDPKWTKPPDAVLSSDTITEKLRENIGAPDSELTALKDKDEIRTSARVNAALSEGGKIYEAEYQAQLLSHSPMEPMNATAHVTPDGCEIWAPTQVQKRMRADVATALALPEQAVTVHTTLAGGGFGRRLETDYGVFAALASKAVGIPVKLIWTREEDMTHDFYRPASLGRLRAALNTDLTIRALDYTGATSNDTAQEGIARNYPCGDVLIRQKMTPFQFPVGAWRSVDQSITIFFIESLIDEIAHGEGLDALTYRRLVLAKDTRNLRTLNAAAEMANWGHAPAGRAQGIAFFNSASWGTSVAHVIEISVDGKSKITLHQVYCAIDPGLAINPNQIAAQAEGGIIMGLSAAINEQITLKDGRTEQKNFDTYPVLRLASVPEIHVRVLETEDVPVGGCGEPPVPPVAPALTNAIFAATGKRIRTLPLVANGFTV